MNSKGCDSKVKKTLVRNFELKANHSIHKQSVLDMGCSSKLSPSEQTSSSQKENELNQPSLCSSEALANYLSYIKKALPSSTSPDKLKKDKCQIGAKITKKLNFHFNDRIYKNLVELNANVDDVKTKRDKRGHSATKRDLEPNIEDFCQDETENDIIPNVPVIKPKFKPVIKVENGQLHKLTASFEDL